MTLACALKELPPCEVRLTLSIPEGQYVFIDRDLSPILNRKIKNDKNYSHANKIVYSSILGDYSDLLLHDMGEGLADGRPDFLADGNEWRTRPLWGIGLTQTVNPQAGFLHDGRAATLEEAILWHGGEAQQSTDDFMALSQDERNQVIVFLRSL